MLGRRASAKETIASTSIVFDLDLSTLVLHFSDSLLASSCIIYYSNKR